MALEKLIWKSWIFLLGPFKAERLWSPIRKWGGILMIHISVILVFFAWTFFIKWIRLLIQTPESDIRYVQQPILPPTDPRPTVKNLFHTTHVCTCQLQWFASWLRASAMKIYLSYHYQIATSHYNDVLMSAMASQITSFTIVYSTVYSDADQRQHQSSASLALVRGINQWPMNSPHKGPVTRKIFPFDDVIM